MEHDTITLQLSGEHSITMPLDMWHDLLHMNRGEVLRTLGITERRQPKEDGSPFEFSINRDSDGQPRLVIHRT